MDPHGSDSKTDADKEMNDPVCEGLESIDDGSTSTRRMDSVGEKEAGWFRTALPQILASTAKNLLLLEIGMIQGYPTILLPAVQNVAGPLGIDDYHASWIGSISYICQPIGSLLSGIILDPIGRKWAMMLINFPVLVGWLLIYFATSPAMFLAAFGIMGFAVGLMEAPILTYVGEISQPGLRGILASYAQLCWVAGFLVAFVLGVATDWRNAALISMAVPVLGVICISQVPETPMWLLSRDRPEDAEKSLRWLRGWVSAAAVQPELTEMKLYRETVLDGHAAAEESWGNALWRKITLLYERTTLRPLLVVSVFFFLQAWTGQTGVRPYLVQVCKEFNMPLDPHYITVALGVMNILGIFACLVLIRKVGKRVIALTSLAIGGLSCMCLAVYAFAQAQNFANGPIAVGPWLPLVFLVVMILFTSFGTLPIPWTLVSEVFPFRTRGLASGVSASICYLLSFSASKTFLDLKESIGLYGIFMANGAIGLAGMFFMYHFLYETEGRSLEEIEEHYAGHEVGRMKDVKQKIRWWAPRQSLPFFQVPGTSSAHPDPSKSVMRDSGV